MIKKILKKEKKPERPEFELAHGAWTRDDFETFKRLSNGRPGNFEVFVIRAIKGYFLNPRSYNDEEKSYETYYFEGIDKYDHLLVRIHFSDSVDSELLEEDDKLNSDEYVGYASLDVGRFSSDEQERLLERHYDFSLKKNQEYFPTIDIKIYPQYGYRKEALLLACQNAKRQGGMLAIKFNFDTKKGIEKSWNEFKTSELETVERIPATKMEFWMEIPFEGEFYEFNKRDFNLTLEETIGMDKIDLDHEKKNYD